ncbi:hypothetical protein ACGFXC_34780 [Streptomyces sp. NPDC048507]|uniref:hypothetical protein n=1 Tax=Streptomyces sp. NPDC048507 TaxID=3365560 RepID=UPI0037241FAE
MPTRHAPVGPALGSALALSGTAVTARAAEPAQPATAAPSSSHFSGFYAGPEACRAAGQAKGHPFTCEFTDFNWSWALYLWY